MLMRALPLKIVFSALLVYTWLGCAKTPTAPSAMETVLFAESFGSYQNGLITNELSFWSPATPGTRHSEKWELTSGSLFAQEGVGWTGVPDNVGPNALSTNGNNSAVFRLTTKRADFGSVSVSLELLNLGLTQTNNTPATGLDGVHIFLRYQSEEQLYYASVNRRDNTAVIKKKAPGGVVNGGTYYDLTNYVPNPVPYGLWQEVSASVATNLDGSVANQESRQSRSSR
jgi:hypothetical protein